MHPEATNNGRVYRFGQYEVDSRSGELRKNRTRLRLPGQPFEILLMLLERPGEVVLRDEIRLRLWPADTCVDFDSGINTSVRRLRHALGDTATQPRYVESVGRRGYRFIAELEAQLEDVTAQTPNLPRSRSHWFWLAGGMGLLCGVIGWQVWRAPGPRYDIAVPLTTLPGVARSPSFSPDGSKVAFVWDGDQQQNTDIYIRQVGTNSLFRLTSDDKADEYPAWSPDDRNIAFVRTESSGTGFVTLMSPLGGQERRICELGPRAGPREVGSPALLSWTPDSKWLAVASRSTDQEPTAIWLVSVDTGERRRLTSPPGLADADVNPSVSPDGTLLAFSRQRTSLYAHSLYVTPLTGDWKPRGEPRLLEESSRMINGIAWASPREIVFSAGGGASGHLWRAEVSGKRPVARLSFQEDAVHPTISTSTHRLAYAWRNFEGDIWRLNTRTGERKPLIVARGTQAFPQYSPDGRTIAFASTRTGDQEIWTCSAEGVNCTQLTWLRGPQTGVPRWSPDGRWLVFDTRLQGRPQILKVPADGGATTRVSAGQFDDFSPTWSSDGKWIYYGSSRTGRWEIWKVPAQGGPAVQVTHEGGYLPEATRDGTMLCYVKREKPGLFCMAEEGGTEEQVLPRLAAPAAWAVGAGGVYFFEPEDSAPGEVRIGFHRPGPPAVLRFAEFRGRTRPVSELERRLTPLVGMSTSPDGQYLLGAWFHLRSDVMLVDQFR